VTCSCKFGPPGSEPWHPLRCVVFTAVSGGLLGSPGIVAAGRHSRAIAKNMQETDIGVGSDACCDYGGCMQSPMHLPQGTKLYPNSALQHMTTSDMRKCVHGSFGT